MNTQQILPKVSQCFEVGAILENSWGWEQTNIDFYCIIKMSGGWVTVLPMRKNVSAEVGFMTNHCQPTEINWNAKPQRKKIHVYGGTECFSFGNYAGAGSCSLWDGKESTETHYA